MQAISIMKKGTAALLALTCLSLWTSPVHAQRAPLQSGVAAIDIPNSRAKSVTMDIEDGEFGDYVAKRLILRLQEINFRNGNLQNMLATVQNATMENIQFSNMELNTGPFSFDTFELLNHQRFVLPQPINANVSLTLTEENLNYFFRHPETTRKLEEAVAKSMGGIKLVQFANPSVSFQKNKTITMNYTLLLVGSSAVPVSLNGKLGLEGGNLVFQNLKMKANGGDLPLPMDISRVLEGKINEIINFKKLGKKNLAINARTLSVTDSAINVVGTAQLTKLQFGK